MAGVAILATLLAPATAVASELIGRDATDVRLQADAQGRALISFRSEGQSRQLVAWGAVDARPPSRSRPQVAFELRSGGSIGPNTCGAYRGPPLAWKVVACTASDGSHWAVQAWQRMLPNYGAPSTGTRGAWELRLSHWAGPLPVLEIWTDWVVPALPPPLRAAHLSGRGRLRLRVDTVRRDPLDTYGRNIFLDTLRLGVRDRLEAGEQLPDARPRRGLLLRLLPTQVPHRVGNGTRYPGDRDRAGRHARRHVAGARAWRIRRGRGRRSERRAARRARGRPALRRQLSGTPGD